MKWTKNKEPIPDEPSAIIDGCIEARKELIAGFGGREGTDRRKWQEAQKPTSAAISLAGEPTMYPRISDLIGEFKRRRMASFLVTNGTRPDRLSSLEHEPTNLYISLCAPDAATYKKVNRPTIANGWKKLNESLALMKSFECRTVLRLTLVKGLNMHAPEKYARILKKSGADICEPKSYAWMGESRERLGRECVPSMDEMRAFAKAVADASGYEIADEDVASKVLMLKS